MADTNVNSRSKASQTTTDAAQLPRTLRGGDMAMRDKGTEYLPKWPKESDQAWIARRDSSFLFNAYEQAIDSHVGKVFSHNVVLGEDVPDQIRTWWENLDLNGQHGDIFSAAAFSDSLDPGVGFILTDFPISEKQVSRAEEHNLGLRPYCTYIPAESVLGWRAERIGGVETLTLVRILEETEEPDGDWGEQVVKRVRVFRRDRGSEFVMFELYQEGSASTAGVEHWQKVDEGVMKPMTTIPLRPFYPKRFGLMQGRPWLRALAWKNLEHWQSASDQRAGLHFARAKAIKVIGTSAEDFEKSQGTVGYGHGTVIFNPVPGGDIEFMQYDSGGLEVGERDLVKIEEHMTILGLEPLLHRPGSRTATEIDAYESRANSRLLAAGRAFGDTLEGVFEDMATWAGLESSGSVKLNEDYGLTIGESTETELLLKARIAGEITGKLFLTEIKRRGILGGDVDVDDEIEAVGAESTTPGPEGRTRAAARDAMRARGMSDEEIDEVLDGDGGA